MNATPTGHSTPPSFHLLTYLSSFLPLTQPVHLISMGTTASGLLLHLSLLALRPSLNTCDPSRTNRCDALAVYCLRRGECRADLTSMKSPADLRGRPQSRVANRRDVYHLLWQRWRTCRLIRCWQRVGNSWNGVPNTTSDYPVPFSDLIDESKSCQPSKKRSPQPSTAAWISTRFGTTA